MIRHDVVGKCQYELLKIDLLCNLAVILTFHKMKLATDDFNSRPEKEFA